MADIDLERRRGGGLGWLWWTLAVLLLALIAWWLWPDGDETELDDIGIDPVESVEPAPATPAATVGPVTDIVGVSVPEILADPGAWIGESFPAAEVTAVEVPTDRGFWVEDEGARLFALIIDRPEEQPKDINPGAMLDIEGGTLRDASSLGELPGAPLDEATRDIARQQEVFLVVDEAEITVLEGGEPQPGTDPAEAVQQDP